MARGIPIVTTSIGAEGIAKVKDDVMVITNPGDDFSQAVLRALDDDQTEVRAQKARKLMEDKFSWKAITEQLVELYKLEN